MRWLFLALALFGIAFVALMIFGPGGGGGDARDPPAWARGMGALIGSLAPRVKSFEGGAREVVLGGGESAEFRVPRDMERENRMLTLGLISGGPVVAEFSCAWAPGAPCERDMLVQTVCLGAPLDPACDEQDGPAAEASFSVSAGGGRIVFSAGDAGARLGIAE
jgi:hypothetical protein